MKDVDVSILMPSLNVVKYIEQCIDSVSKQTIKNIEILCIDAGSTDGTLEVLKQYAKKDSRIRIINSEVKSYGYQMNLGLKEAKGKYIGIVETDDFIDKEMFASLYKYAKKKNADIVFEDYFAYETKSNLSVKQNSFTFISQGDCVLDNQKKNKALFMVPAIWRGLYNTKFLKENDINFVESKGASFQDTGFFTKCFIAQSKIAISNKAHYHYRTDNDNSSVHSTGKLFCVCDEMNSALEYLKAKRNNDDKFERLLWRKKYEVYTWNLTRLNKEAALRFLDKMREEFAEANDLGILSDSVFDEYREELEILLNNPEQYLFATEYVAINELFNDDCSVAELQLLIKRQNNTIKNMEKNTKYKDIEINALKNSAPYRVGYFLTDVPRKFKNFFRNRKAYEKI